MGRKSREKRERRQRRNLVQDRETFRGVRDSQGPAEGESSVESRLERLADGDLSSWVSKDAPGDLREGHLSDVLAFEDVGKGTSLFIGLQQRGVRLPNPEELDEEASADRVMEIFNALALLGVFLVGFEDMSARDLYATLWNQTLWEGCCIDRKVPGGITIIDVSRSMSQADVRAMMDGLMRETAVH